MNELDDIIKSLATKNHSSLMAEEKPKPPPPTSRQAYEPRVYATGPSLVPPPSGRAYDEHRPPRVGPMDRMGIINSPSGKPMPKRAPFNMFSLSDEDLDFAFSVKVKRGWDFEQWLEVIGFPPDLHKKLDGASYSYAEKAFIRLKQEAHRS